MSKYKLLDFETVEKALQADSVALQKVISHYTSYICCFCQDDGKTNYNIADEVKAHLMQAVLKFNIRHD